ncbi:DUF4383 domain-containing protein [Leptolyngbya ohadii]|uniref:DUF4383 domain-containing protein n=1 Tax=Leptolyngbya ohadii TaxID=1962290 RepID=UPI000B5993E6|nr:DUF4383 domain-containing protein [Leptolyngbya ohadii]
MGARYFALIAGVVYVLVGILGFIPGMVAAPGTAPQLAVDSGYGFLMGLFPINVLHNLVHLAVGVWGLLSYPRYGSARTFCRGLAIFYGLLTIMGFFPVLNTTFGLIPIFGHDIWLHAVTALIAAYFGFKGTRNTADVRDNDCVTVGGYRDR